MAASDINLDAAIQARFSVSTPKKKESVTGLGGRPHSALMNLVLG
jgi:hypothetical protein